MVEVMSYDADEQHTILRQLVHGAWRRRANVGVRPPPVGWTLSRLVQITLRSVQPISYELSAHNHDGFASKRSPFTSKAPAQPTGATISYPIYSSSQAAMAPISLPLYPDPALPSEELLVSQRAGKRLEMGLASQIQ